MGNWYDNQKQSNSSILQLLQKRMAEANPRREQTALENRRLNKLEAIAEKLKRGENVQSSGRVTHYLHTNYFVVLNA